MATVMAGSSFLCPCCSVREPKRTRQWATGRRQQAPFRQGFQAVSLHGLLQQYCVNRISSNIQQPSAFKHRCDCSSELTRKAWAFLLYMFPLQVSLKKKIKKNPSPLGKTVTILLYPFTFFGFGLSVCQQNNDERILLKISGNADNDSRNRTAVSKNASSKSHFVGKCAAWQRSALYKSAFYGVIP